MKKKIMIDLDQTICDGGYLDIVNEYLNTSYKVEDIDTYYYEDLIPRDKLDGYPDFFYQHNVYDYVWLLEDAYSVLEKLNQKYEVFICSSYVNDDCDVQKSYIHLSNKFKFLLEQLPFLNPHNYIFTSRKDVIDCDIKIDDKLSNLEGPGEIKLLFDSYHNRNISDKELEDKKVRRVYSWKEIEEILL